MSNKFDYFGARGTFDTGSGEAVIYRIGALRDHADVDRLPFSIKVMLEQALRQVDDFEIKKEDVINIASWQGDPAEQEIPFKPARVILQDFTGVPAVVDWRPYERRWLSWVAILSASIRWCPWIW